MVLALLSRVARVRVTLVYAAALIAVTTILLSLAPDVQDRVIRHASTNLHNLAHGRVGTLLGSVFVIDAGPIYMWLPGLVCLLALGELLWRSGRLVVAFVLGHVGATLLVAAGLTASVELGWVPVTVARATDVGMSYGATAVLGAITPAIPRNWRPAWVGWWLTIGTVVVFIGRDFSDAGHLVALVLGMVVATRFGQPQPWTPARVVLLAIATLFGYLILVSSGTPMPIATCAGLVGALLGALVTLQRGVRVPSSVTRGQTSDLSPT
jgi:hypothetical protein